MVLPPFDPQDPTTIANALEAIVKQYGAAENADEPITIIARIGDLQALVDAAIIHEMDDDLARYVEAIATYLVDGHPGGWIGDIPLGATAALALGRRDPRYLTLFAEFLSIVDVERYADAGSHVIDLIDRYGLVPESMYLLMLWSAGIRASDGASVFAEVCRRHLVLEWLEEHGQRLDFINVVAADQANADLERGLAALPDGAWDMTPQALGARGFRGAVTLRKYVDALCADSADLLRAMRDVSHRSYLQELHSTLNPGVEPPSETSPRPSPQGRAPGEDTTQMKSKRNPPPA